MFVCTVRPAETATAATHNLSFVVLVIDVAGILWVVHEEKNGPPEVAKSKKKTK